jgi:hypothetical protein
LLNSISSLTIVHSKDFFNFKYLKYKKLSNALLILLSIACLIIAFYQFSVLYLFLLADLLCCACVYVVFKGFYQNKVDFGRSLFLIIIGLCSGLLFFPSIDFSKSLLIGILFDKDVLHKAFNDNLLFYSFLTASSLPIVLDPLVNVYNNFCIKKK